MFNFYIRSESEVWNCGSYIEDLMRKQFRGSTYEFRLISRFGFQLLFWLITVNPDSSPNFILINLRKNDIYNIIPIYSTRFIQGNPIFPTNDDHMWVLQFHTDPLSSTHRFDTPLSSTPKTPQFNTKTPSVPHQDPSVQHKNPVSSTPKIPQFSAPFVVELSGVLYWRAFGLKLRA